MLCQARSWQVGPVKKDMSPVALRVVIYCAPPTCEERGRGNARADTDCPKIFGRTEAREKAKRGTRARRGAFRRRRVR